MTRAIPFLAIAACGVACSKAPRVDHTPDAAAVVGTTQPLAARDGGGARAKAEAKPERWEGTYSSSAATVYVPPAWKGVHWSVKDSPAGLGEGRIALKVDSTSGEVTGSLEGPLGPAVIEGRSAGDRLTASISRKDPSDRGFTGTLEARIAGDALSGTMHVSPADANSVRSAKFSLTRARSE